MDTSTWLDLAKPRIEEVLFELEQQVEQGITILLTCDIIVQEWGRNKERVFNEVIDSIRSHAKSALKMADLLPEPEKSDIHRIIKKYTEIEAEQETLAKVYFDRVERLLHRSEVYKIKDTRKIEMADRAVAKQAPFHNSKNNMSDALLYYGAVDHVEKNEIATDLIFVTSNKKEFSDPTDFRELHPELYVRNVHFSTNLAEALKMRKEVIDLLDEYTEYQFGNWIDSEVEIARGK